MTEQIDADVEKDIYSQLYGIASELSLKDGVRITESIGGTLHGTFAQAPFVVVMLSNAVFPSRRLLAVTWNNVSRLDVLGEDTAYTNSGLADWVFDALMGLSAGMGDL